MKLLQQKAEPLFPDLLWSKPENKRQAGKVLVIGGQAGQFTNVANSFQVAEKAGAGHVRALLPDSLQKFTQHLPGIEYAPSNQSGSFSRQALADFNEASTWADGVLLAGDFGKNSETTTVLDGYLLRCLSPATITSNSIQSISLPLSQLSKRPLTIVLDWTIFQKRVSELELATPFLSSDPVEKTSDNLSELSKVSKASFVLVRDKRVWCASQGRVSLTHASTPIDSLDIATFCTVWAIQQPDKIFEAITTACFEQTTSR